MAMLNNQMLIQSDVAMNQNPDTLGHSCFDIKLALGLTLKPEIHCIPF
jgi:hypothetical protein